MMDVAMRDGQHDFSSICGRGRARAGALESAELRDSDRLKSEQARWKTVWQWRSDD